MCFGIEPNGKQQGSGLENRIRPRQTVPIFTLFALSRTPLEGGLIRPAIDQLSSIRLRKPHPLTPHPSPLTLSPCLHCTVGPATAGQSLGCHPLLTHRPSPPNLRKSAEPSREGVGGGQGKEREQSAVKKAALFSRHPFDLRHGPAQHDNTKEQCTARTRRFWNVAERSPHRGRSLNIARRTTEPNINYSQHLIR